jgi:hypothetical protein
MDGEDGRLWRAGAAIADDQGYTGRLWQGLDGSVEFSATFTTSASEPSTWAMLILGFAGIGSMGKGRLSASPLSH